MNKNIARIWCRLGGSDKGIEKSRKESIRNFFNIGWSFLGLFDASQTSTSIFTNYFTKVNIPRIFLKRFQTLDNIGLQENENQNDK